MTRCGERSPTVARFYAAAPAPEIDLDEARECAACYVLYCSRRCAELCLKECAACDHVECVACTMADYDGRVDFSTRACLLCGA